MNTNPYRSAWRAGIPALLAALLPPIAGCMMDDTDVPPPVISQSPRVSAVADGSSVTLAVKAAGSGPLNYQWQRDGQPIAGARAAEYTTQPLSASDHQAQYRVLVTNAGGVASSLPVQLQVLATGPMAAQLAVTSR